MGRFFALRLVQANETFNANSRCTLRDAAKLAKKKHPTHVCSATAA
jgi:hypothetical protein